MEETEFNEKLKQIEADFELAKKKLYVDYVNSNLKFKKGDIIKNSVYTILIDKINVSKSFGLPEPVYSGLELKKDLTPRKDGSRGSIFGNEGELIKPGNIESNK